MDMDQVRGTQLDRRRLITRALQVGGLAAIGVPLLEACGSSSSGGTAAVTPSTGTSGSPAAADLGTLTYQLSWVPDVEFAGSYIADTTGIYAANGFSGVTLIPGGPSAPAAETQVVSGKAFVATSSPDATASAITKGAGLKVIAAQYQKNPFCVMSLEKSPLKTPQDMIGKKIGVQAPNDNVWNAFLKANNIDASKVDTVPVQFDPTPLTTGDVDGWFSFITNEPIELELEGFPTYTFLLADFNYPLVGNAYLTTTDALTNDRDKIKAFLKSEVQGWTASIADPAKGATLATKKYGKSLKLNPKAELLQSKAQNKLITYATSASSGILLVSPTLQSQTVKTLGIGGITITADQMFDMTPLQEVYSENPTLAS
jgi:ABC-type nitrate/sulfonate/bicarbonate transport system substrate-binding protein